MLSSGGATLSPGVHLIGRLGFDLVDNDTHLGSEVAVSVHGIIIGDSAGVALATHSRNGLPTKRI